MRKCFHLAPMSTSILVLTMVLWMLPFSFLAYSIMTGYPVIGGVTLSLFALYGAVWIFCRPSRFELSNIALAIVFPSWTRNIPLRDIRGVSELSAGDFKKRYGWAMRIGVGGLWGGFGWLWTSRGGLVEFYVSRTDGLVMVERANGSNILITPDGPDDFTAGLRQLVDKESSGSGNSPPEAATG